METDKKQRAIRVWKHLDIKNVKEHLLLVDDLYGSCASCKQLGLNYLKDRKCTKCGTEFRYLSTRLRDPAQVSRILKRIQTDSLPFTLIDRDDYEKADARTSVQDLFSKG